MTGAGVGGPSASSRWIYLDHNATTPPAPEVAEAMGAALREAWGNPSSAHPAGRAARQAVERAADQVASLIGARPDEIVFTSGGTESNDLALRGVMAGAPADGRGIVTSTVEHPSVAATIDDLEARGCSVRRLAPGPSGCVTVPDPTALRGAALLTVMLANNETGAIQPVGALARAAHAAGARVHTDAAQAVGRIPVDVDHLDVDLLTIAGHKLYGPKGIGALYVRRGTTLTPRLLGGGQQRGLRPGTEPVPSIVGLGVACVLARGDLERERLRQEALRDRLAALLQAAVPGITVTAADAPRLPNTLNVRFPADPSGAPSVGARILARAPEIAASTGSACHAPDPARSSGAGIDRPSQVLLAMGVAPSDAVGAVRLSLGRATTEADVDIAAAALARAWSGEHGHR